MAKERVLDLAATRERRGSAPVSGMERTSAVAHLRYAAPGRRQAMWRATDRVPGGALGGPATPRPPPRVTGSSTDPAWQALLEGWGIYRRPSYEGPTGIASVVLDAANATRHVVALLMGQAPHYSGGRQIRQ